MLRRGDEATPGLSRPRIHLLSLPMGVLLSASSAESTPAQPDLCFGWSTNHKKMNLSEARAFPEAQRERGA
jgi:hypothetical protein